MTTQFRKAGLALICLILVSNAMALPAQQSEGLKQATSSPELEEASRLSQQVVTLYNRGKYDDALPFAKRALELRQKALGPEHQLVGLALKNLASLFFAKKQYDESTKLYQRTLSVYEKAFGVADPKTAEILDNLGWSAYGNGDTRNAESCFERGLAIREKSFGSESKETGNALYMLGQFYNKIGNSKKAAEYYTRAIPIKEKLLGPKDPEFHKLLEKCWCALTQIGKTAEAAETRTRMTGTERDPVRHSGGLLQGAALVRAEPIYPAAAKNERLSGTVIVEVLVDESGNVIQTRAVCGPDLLVQAAVDAAWKWRFSPTRLSGVPVKVIGTLTFNFKI